MVIVPITQMTPVAPVGEKGAAAQGGAQAQGLPFADVLSSAMKNLAETQAESQKAGYELALGQVDDLHNVQITSMKAAAAVDFAAGLTSRVLTAYNEIMRMQI